MIDRERTIKEFGYDSDDLSKGSHKRVYAICDECSKERLLRFGAYKNLCRSCAHKRINLSEETLQKMRDVSIKENLSVETLEKLRNAKLGHEVSIKTRRKLSIANSGRKHTDEACKKISEAGKGRKPSLETREKLSESKTGNKNPNWNYNLTDDERIQNREYKEYKEWRTAVFKRDNYTCQVCGDNSGGNLNAHHLNGYANNPGERTLLKNGITLCEKHHKDFHHQYGYGNNIREQFIEFKEGLINDI